MLRKVLKNSQEYAYDSTGRVLGIFRIFLTEHISRWLLLTISQKSCESFKVIFSVIAGFYFASLSEIEIVNSINLSSKLEYGGNIDH